ncbi:MAG: CcoQ/FixQ family Cbb3-type cytochrome c oxidase assembly chaperone [Bacteroidota bacterium]
MKIVIQHLESIDGVEIFAIISLLIFFVFFSSMIIHTLKADKEAMKACGDIPLEDDDSAVSDL